MSVAFQENDLISDVCRASYYEFFKEMWDTVNPEPLHLNWHIEYLSEEIQIILERVFRGLPKLYDLVVNISPGTTKSSLLSVFLTPWIWSRMPHCRVINGSHTQELVLDLSRKSRDVILSPKYQACFPNIQLRDDQNTKGYFANTKGGTRFSCTVGGKTPTGMHGHLHVVDDPIDPARALSDIESNVANAWLDETLSTRKVDKAVTPLILVMQRLTQNDPAGYLLGKKGKKIKWINIPAEIFSLEIKKMVHPPELIKNYVDGLMDPFRLPKDVLDEYKQNGDYFYAGQFLQDPVPPGGGMFKVDRLHISERAPDIGEFKKIVRHWDKAGSSKKGAAWTVGVKMGVTRDIVPQYWILDVKRFRTESADRERRIRETAREDGYDIAIGIEQEGGSGGKESAENTVARLSGYRCVILLPRGDKEWRADPFSSQVNAGNVHLYKAPWNQDYIDEMKHFPHSRYKDQIDATAGAFSVLFKRRRVGAF
jgi:predicted phage terminase large subunit-like protein